MPSVQRSRVNNELIWFLNYGGKVRILQAGRKAMAVLNIIQFQITNH